jgi:hypothetical protein
MAEITVQVSMKTFRKTITMDACNEDEANDWINDDFDTFREELALDSRLDVEIIKSESTFDPEEKDE